LAKFTYIGKETKFITKLFKDDSVNVQWILKCQCESYGKTVIYNSIHILIILSEIPTILT
jgi:hypothetical protein